MKNYFLRLFTFDNWANNLIIKSLEENNINDERIVRILSHVAHAQHNWYYRFIKPQNDVPVWDVLSFKEIAVRFEENGKLWLHAIETMREEDLTIPLSYLNLKKEPNMDTVQDVFAHVVNHASYHRGQVIYLIRECGFTPPATDLIIFARKYPL